MRRQKYLNFINNQRLLVLIALLIVIVSSINSIFLSIDNIVNILFQISINGIIAIGMTYVLIGGDLDLSVGLNMAMAMAMMVLLEDFGPIVSILGALLTSTLIGLLNGVIIAKFKVNSFVTTLGMLFLLKGVILIITGSETIVGNNDIYFKFGYGTFFGVPYSIIILIFFYIIFGFILSKSSWGRHIYAIGTNEKLSSLFGINVLKTKIFCFVLAGMLCGTAGLILFSRINSASATYGAFSNIDALVAAFLGGTSVYGGKGSIYKTFKGVVVLGLLSNASSILGIDPFFQQVVKGLILIFAVVADSYKSKR